MTARLVVCASGEGSNFAALVEAARAGRLPATITGLITNRAQALAVQKAERFGIPVRVLRPKAFGSVEEWDRAMVAAVQELGADWIVLAGFLALIGPRVLAAYPGRVVNSHPALLPHFGGAGMYGDRVHQAVLAAGETETGITVHTIDHEYDRGEILAQTQVPVYASDSVATLAERVKAREREFYPQVLARLISGGAG